MWVEISDGVLSVMYGQELIAELAGIEPQPGDIEAINDELGVLEQAGPAERTFFAMGIETIKRFSKIRGKSPYMDLFFTDVGNTTFCKIGNNFIGGFEAIDRGSVEDPKLFNF